MQANYKPFVDRLIRRYEGPYGWDRRDPGGPTNFGVTCYDLAEHRGLVMNSMEEWAPIVQAMSLAEAEEIYQTKYARTLKFDELPAGVDCCIMDYGVNSGVARAILVARNLTNQAGGKMFDTGLLEAIKKQDPTTFINQMCRERLQFMQRLRTWPTFHNGWTARVNDLDNYATALAVGATVPAAPTELASRHPKAIHTPPATTGVTVTSALVGTIGAHLGGDVPLWAAACLGAGIIVAGILNDMMQQKYADQANNLVVHPGV